jgi:hypothetical protein
MGQVRVQLGRKTRLKVLESARGLAQSLAVRLGIAVAEVMISDNLQALAQGVLEFL